MQAEDAGQGIAGDAASAPRQVAAFVDQNGEQLREGEGGERQIEAFKPCRGHGDDEGNEGAKRHGADESNAEREAELGRENDDAIGPDAGEGEMREGDLAGGAEEKIIAQRQRDPDEHLAIDIGGIAAENEGDGAGRDDGGDPDERADHLTSRGAISPVGRNSKKRISRLNGKARVSPEGIGR